MPPTGIFVFAGVVLLLSILLGVSLSQKDGSVGAPTRARRTAFQLGRIALAPATRILLTQLDALAAAHPSLTDAAAKEALRALLYRSFVQDLPLPETISDEALAACAPELRQVFADFLSLVAAAIGEDGLGSPEERLQAFRDPELRTAAGSGVWTWFPFED
jgi:hypothetical protein